MQSPSWAAGFTCPPPGLGHNPRGGEDVNIWHLCPPFLALVIRVPRIHAFSRVLGAGHWVILQEDGVIFLACSNSLSSTHVSPACLRWPGTPHPIPCPFPRMKWKEFQCCSALRVLAPRGSGRNHLSHPIDRLQRRGPALLASRVNSVKGGNFQDLTRCVLSRLRLVRTPRVLLVVFSSIQPEVRGHLQEPSVFSGCLLPPVLKSIIHIYDFMKGHR